MKPGNNDAELTPVAVPGVDAILPTIEVDDAPIPGSFPSDIETPASKATHLQANSDLQGIDTNPSKPYKCGSCGKTYKNAGGLKYVSWILSLANCADSIEAQGALVMHS